jgi:hypothetical protein
MGNPNVLHVELDTLYGNSVFKVKFANSDAVFVDQYGNILLVRLASTGGGGSGSSSSSSSGDHDDGDSEEHDD